LTLEILIET